MIHVCYQTNYFSLCNTTGFKPNLTERYQRVKLGDCLSSKIELKYGVLQRVRFRSSAFHPLYHSTE